MKAKELVDRVLELEKAGQQPWYDDYRAVVEFREAAPKLARMVKLLMEQYPYQVKESDLDNIASNEDVINPVGLVS